MAAWAPPDDDDPRGCNWWGWWLRYPLDNLRRVWRNLTDGKA